MRNSHLTSHEVAKRLIGARTGAAMILAHHCVYVDMSLKRVQCTSLKAECRLWEAGAHLRKRTLPKYARDSVSLKHLKQLDAADKCKSMKFSDTDSDSGPSDYVRENESQSDSDITIYSDGGGDGDDRGDGGGDGGGDDGGDEDDLPPIVPVDRSKPVAEQRSQGMILVNAHMCRIERDPHFALTGPRARVQEALHRIDLAGHRFWGAFDTYNRRRTVLDSYLARHHQ